MPYRLAPPRDFPRAHHWGGDVLHALFMLALLAVLIALAVWLVTSIRHPAIAAGTAAAPPAPAAPEPDPALREARMRYARGEMSREEFTRIVADLGGPEPAEPGGS
jgi:uncharacterized membrane protein